jgi:hypothetical protein
MSQKDSVETNDFYLNARKEKPYKEFFVCVICFLKRSNLMDYVISFSGSSSVWVGSIEFVQGPTTHLED